MSLRKSAKTVVRSALVHTPRLYELLTSEHRYVVAYRLGRVHETDFRALPNLLSKPEPLVVDVGANLGQSVLSLKRVLPNARIVSFEPNRHPLAALRRLQRRFPDLRVEPFGLSDAPTEIDLYIPVYNGKVMSGLGSMDYSEAQGWLNKQTVIGFRPERLTINTERVQVKTLDDFDLSPDFIKVDVQGFEEQVIRGSLRTIKRSRPVLLLETPPETLTKYLADLGYSAWEYSAGTLKPTTRSHSNQFFLPSGRELL